jgi:hypothetical protein
MKIRQPNQEQFMKDVSGHKMAVILQSGVHRHLLFKKPGSSNLWFEIITWPGALTIHGDMGTWTFSRVEDMFTFFRSRPGKTDLEINPSYWAEKLRGGVHGGSDNSKVWEEDSFRDSLVQQLTEYYSLDGDDLTTVSQALEDQVLRQDGKYDLMIAARDFSCELSGGKGRFEFDTCELPTGMEYAYHFLWCLYAIVWAVRQWDAAESEKAA